MFGLSPTDRRRSHLALIIAVITFVLVIRLLLAAVCWSAVATAACSYGAGPPANSIARLSPGELDLAIGMNLEFLLNNQKDAGNFTYEYDFSLKRESQDDNSVRQAGALWGVTLMHRRTPSERSDAAIRKGLAFFEGLSTVREGKRFIRYPDEDEGRPGTVALVALALIDFARSPTGNDPVFRQRLNEYLDFLVSLRIPNGLFHGSYRLDDGSGFDEPSPYSDGETLLAFAKAAKYLGLEKYKDIAVASAEAMHAEHVTAALKRHPDSNQTKGFYQWGSMAFYEMSTAGWANSETLNRRVIDMAHWMIDVHRVLDRGRNTAYAFEGIAHAWELARISGDQPAMAKFDSVIQRGLARLLSWQVGNASQNAYLTFHGASRDPRARGGVMNGAADPVLRIDVTQHQAHATAAVRDFLYRADGTP